MYRNNFVLAFSEISIILKDNGLNLKIRQKMEKSLLFYADESMVTTAQA